MKPHLCNMCGGRLMVVDNFTTHKEEHRDISLSIVHDLPQSIPQLTILWWVSPDIQETHKTIGHSRRKNRPQLSFQRTPTVNMLTGRSEQSNPQMCLQYWEGDFSWKPCDSTLNTNRQNIGLDTEYNSYNTTGTVPSYSPLYMWLHLMTKDTSNRGPEGRSRVIPKCVYNIEKVISPGNHVIQL